MELRRIQGVEVEFHALLTSAIDGGKRSGLHFGSFILKKEKTALVEYEAGWAPERVGTFCRRE